VEHGKAGEAGARQVSTRVTTPARIAHRVGVLAGVVIACVAIAALVHAKNLPAASAAMPLVFAGSVLVLGLLSLLDGRHAVVARPAKALLACAALLVYATLLFLDVRYWIAITVLIIAGFVVIGRRHWLLMLLFWLGTQALAYGVFGALLGIPIR
jgi:hypothetical protein